MDPDDAQHEQDRGDEMGEILFWPTEKAGIHAANARLDVLEQQVVVLTSVCATQAEQINELVRAGFITKDVVDRHTDDIRRISAALNRILNEW